MILRALWLRPMLARPARTLATVAGVAIGVASVESTLLATRAAIASMGADVATVAGEERLEVTRPGGVDVADLALLEPLCDEALVAPVVEGVALLPELGDVVRVTGLDLLLGGGPSLAALGAGVEDPERAREAMLHGRGVAIARGLADELGVAAGDELTIVVRAHEEPLEVAAVVAPDRLASTWERVLVADVALAQELLGRVGRFDRVELRPRGPLELDDLRARAEGLLPPSYRVAPPEARMADGARLVAALEFNLTALAGVSVLVAVVLVATTLATSVVQRRAQIALLRSLGASRAQLARAVLIEAAAIGLAGGVAGVVLGWLGARAALASVRATVATITTDVLPGVTRLEPLHLALGLVLGLGSAVVAALLPLQEAARTPPVQGLRTENPETVVRRPWRARALATAALLGGAWLFAQLPAPQGRPVWALVSTLLLLATLLVLAAPFVDLCAALHARGVRAGLATPVRLAQAAVEAGRRRAAWAAGAVGIAAGLAVAMTAMVGSFRQSIVEWTEQTMRSDLFLRPLATEGGTPVGRLDPAALAVVRRELPDALLDAYHQSTARVRKGDALLEVALGGAEFPVLMRTGGVPFVSGRPSREVFREAVETGAVVVNEPFWRIFGVGAGDELELVTPAGVVTRRVAGVHRDYSSHGGRVVLSRDDFLSLYPDEGPNSIAVFLPEGADVEAARRRLAAAFAGRFLIDVRDHGQVRADVLRVFERTFAVTIALQLVAAVVAAIAVVTVLGALITERRRELAVVRVLGGSRAQLAGIVVAEALLLGLAGALGGLVVGLGVGYVLVAIVNVQSFGWTLRFAPPASVLWSVGAVLPACLLAGLVPALMALRSAPREALRASG